MARKGNPSGKVPASSLEQAVELLVSQLGVEEVPPGWFASIDIADRLGEGRETVRKRLLNNGLQSRVFRVFRDGKIKYMVHFFIEKNLSEQD